MPRPHSFLPLRRVLVALGTTAALLGAPPLAPGSPGVARSTDPANVRLDGTVVVSPTIVRLGTVQPGSRRTFAVTIRNRRKVATSFELVGLGVRGSSDPNLAVQFLEPGSRGWADTAAPWLQPAQSTIRLAPRGVAVVQVAVAVPGDLHGGGEFAALAVRQAAGTTSASGAAVGLQGEVAVVVLARAPGGVRRHVELRRLDAPTWRTSRARWNDVATLRNRGNVEERMSGTISVRSVVVHHVVAHYAVATRTMLPGGAGVVQARWRHVPLIGIYRVQLRLRGEGRDAPSITRDTWLFVLPPWWVFVAIALLVGGWIAWSRRRDRREVDRLLADDDFDAEDDGLGGPD